MKTGYTIVRTVDIGRKTITSGEFQLFYNESTPTFRVAVLKYIRVGWLITLEKTVNRDNSKALITSK